MGNRLETGRGIEYEDFLDGIVEDEIMRHPDVETDADKVGNIWSILGLTDEADLAKILGIREKQIPKIFKASIADRLKDKLNRTFAYASILERNIEDLSERDRQLQRPHPFLKNQSPIQAIRRGQIDKVLYFAALSQSSNVLTQLFHLPY